MKKLLTLILVFGFAVPVLAEVKVNWWGQAAFRVRQETTKEYTDVSFTRGPGILLNTVDNTTTRAGYQLGLRFLPRDNVTIGLAFRSGLYGSAQVMLQDINSREGMLPAIQEAFIDWQTPYAGLELGKIPQDGTPLWDLYAATLQTDFRADDPRDGIFNDRMASLNGARITVPVWALNLRGTYHTDYVAGYLRKNEDASVSRVRNPDRGIYLLGFDFEGSRLEADGTLGMIMNDLTVYFDLGLPFRAAVMTDPDSGYAVEDIWGLGLKKSYGPVSFFAGYAYNWRDSVYTNEFTDVGLSGDVYGFKPAVRYQYGVQKHEFGVYKGHEVKRTALHLYLNKMVWGVDVQPRVILFENEISGFKSRKQTRMELTTSVRF